MALTVSGDDRSAPRVHLWVREAAPYGATDRVRAVHGKLRQLADSGDVAAVDVGVWGRTVSLSRADAPDDHSATLRETLDEFRAWADRTDHALEPAFGVHDRISELTGERERVVTLPVICLAVYVDDALAAVFPCSETDGVSTVADCLDRLESGDLFVGEAEQPAD